MTARSHVYVNCDWPGCASSSDDLQAWLGATPTEVRKQLAEHGWSKPGGNLDVCGHHPLAEHAPTFRRGGGLWDGWTVSCACGWSDKDAVRGAELSAKGRWREHVPREEGWCPTAAPSGSDVGANHRRAQGT